MASTSCITDLKSVLTTGPTAATKLKAIDAGGPIMDWQGMVQSALLNLEEANRKLTDVISVTDGSDGTKTTLQGVLDSLD